MSEEDRADNDKTILVRGPDEPPSEGQRVAHSRPWIHSYLPWLLWGAVAIGASLLLFVWAGFPTAEPEAPVPTAKDAQTSDSPVEAQSPGDASDLADAAVVDAAPEAATPARPPVWRISALASEGAVFADAALGKRTLQATMRALGLAPADLQHVLSSFDDKPSKLGPKATVSIAKEKGTSRILALEIAATPTEVWQASRDSSGAWTGKKLDLFVEHKKLAKAVPVRGDLHKALVDAGFDEQLVSMIDEALDGHADISKLRAGCTFKIVATEEVIEGVFARYSELHAVEYQPAGRHKPIRVYHYNSGNKKPIVGYFNSKGEDPYRGKFRAPIPLARISSRFNPNRMHPVLHVVMPHNGIDFAASTGTPIYAPAAGTFGSVGDGGPCGNMIQIQHQGGLTSVYCHLSRFAPNSHSGGHVEERQLIGYVGQTGRVTGPHLHFGIKRGDRFIDPATLKMDGVRVLPKGKMREFAELRERLDKELDAIGAPQAQPADTESDAGVEDSDAGEVIYETP